MLNIPVWSGLKNESYVTFQICRNGGFFCALKLINSQMEKCHKRVKNVTFGVTGVINVTFYFVIQVEPPDNQIFSTCRDIF